MDSNQRRQSLWCIAKAFTAWSFLGAQALAQHGAGRPASGGAGTPAAKVSKLAPVLRIVVPAGPGGGWDQTGRALGAALVGVGATDQVEYENIGGKGGIVGLAKYAEKYESDPDTLFIGGLVMVGAAALHKPAKGLSQIQPLARLTSDYLIAAVADHSPIKTVKELAEAMRTNLRNLPIGGGSAGGVDHMFAGLLARAVKANVADINYRSYQSGAEVVEALASGKIVVGISGYSEFGEALSARKLRSIGVSSRHGSRGTPSFRDEGLDATIDNWRGVFTGSYVSPARALLMQSAVEAAVHHDSWQRALIQHRWAASWLGGKDLAESMKLDEAMAAVLVYLLKLKA